MQGRCRHGGLLLAVTPAAAETTTGHAARQAYRTRPTAMLDCLPDALPPGSTWSVPDGGMFLWAPLPDGWDTEAFAPHTLHRNVTCVPGAPFFAGAPLRASMRLAFITRAPQDITEGPTRPAAPFKQ
ncbi:hypothetical protein [Streptomyces sp. NPDC004065]|uniref:hypothetical protein n=1 Tax=Streptomyces sp. NPDC004065 TaxID=3364689 RepID=UPI0038515B3A